MNKSDLKCGYIVELKNHDRYLVFRNLQCCEMKLKNLDDGVYEIAIKEFDNELKYGTYIDLCYSDRFNIMKVYKDYTLKELLWERKEKSKLTDDEKVTLRNLPKEYEYIARDENGHLYVYKNKPIKSHECWSDYTNSEFCFPHLFQFIKWEDEEPYLIKDLLKE